MSDDDDFSYEYDDDDNNQFEYTDEEEEQDDAEVALENAYYNAKGLRETSVEQAAQALEQVIVQERQQLSKDNKEYGPWSYKALKQLVKLQIRSATGRNQSTTTTVLDPTVVMEYYNRLLDCISSKSSHDVSPAQIEKGINGMLERVSSLYNTNNNAAEAQDLALAVYDATLKVFHPTTGPCSNERLWFKTNIKYGQLLYERNETHLLQTVLSELKSLLHKNSQNNTNNNSSSTNQMEIYALEIQLCSRMKDDSKLRETFHKAMNVRGGIPHPRTIALIQELGGKMHMSHGEYEEAGKTFFQAFKSYDEAGDPSRLRCLKYLVLASMLHASAINPFDSQEARPYRDDPEITAMTSLVQAFHNNEIQQFETILRRNQGRIMADEFVRGHIQQLLRTIRTQVLRRFIRPYKRISLTAIAVALNDIPVKDVESLLVSLILDGTVEGTIDLSEGVLLKAPQRGGGDSSAASTQANKALDRRKKSATMQKCEAMDQLTGMLDDLSQQILSRGSHDSGSSGVMGSGMRSRHGMFSLI